MSVNDLTPAGLRPGFNHSTVFTDTHVRTKVFRVRQYPADARGIDKTLASGSFRSAARLLELVHHRFQHGPVVDTAIERPITGCFFEPLLQL